MNEYSKIKKLINEVDAIIVGAGAGLSTSAGIDYEEKSFKENFPELVEKYRMTDMYSSSFYNFQSEDEKWSYWAKHINYLYNIEAKRVYINLFQLIKNKRYYVITTNVDGQFLKSGFAHDRVFEVQGSLAKMQCSVGCHNKLYNNLNLVEEMLKENINCQIPTNLIPKCPVCGKNMEVNLRKDAFFVEDDNWQQHNISYEKFINENKNKRIVFLEFGVGFNTPGIIRFPFETLTLTLANATLIRINNKFCDVAYEIQDKAILLNQDCDFAIKEILNAK